MISELLPLIGGGVFGAVVKLFSMGMNARREERRGVIEALKAQAGVYESTNNLATSSNGFAVTRRIIALSVTATVVYLAIGVEDLNVMHEVKSGGRYFFGLFDNTSVDQVWTKLRGGVALPVITQSFQVIIGAYFGASIAGSK